MDIGCGLQGEFTAGNGPVVFNVNGAISRRVDLVQGTILSDLTRNAVRAGADVSVQLNERGLGFKISDHEYTAGDDPSIKGISARPRTLTY
jgi:hypothetical protein